MKRLLRWLQILAISLLATAFLIGIAIAMAILLLRIDCGDDQRDAKALGAHVGRVAVPDGGLNLTDRTTTTVRASRSKLTSAHKHTQPTHGFSAPTKFTSATNTASIQQLDALADCESGDGDGRPPHTHNMAAANGPYRGPFQWAQRWWDRHVARMGRPELVGADLHTLPYETQRAVTQAVPLPAWPHQFPSCARKLGVA